MSSGLARHLDQASRPARALATMDRLAQQQERVDRLLRQRELRTAEITRALQRQEALARRADEYFRRIETVQFERLAGYGSVDPQFRRQQIRTYSRERYQADQAVRRLIELRNAAKPLEVTAGEALRKTVIGWNSFLEYLDATGSHCAPGF